MESLRRTVVLAVVLVVVLFGCVGCFAVPDAVPVVHLVEVVIPAAVPSVGEGVLVGSLFAFDPAVAGAEAMLVEEHVRSFVHRAGVPTTVEIAFRTQPPADLEPYVTVRGYERAGGTQRYVLWDGQQGTGMPERVTMEWLPEE